MKKTLLVAALAAVTAVPAMAQSSVTVYGRLNTSIERIKSGDVTTTDIVNNSSRLGFKGTEDLGGGLKANFIIEHRFASDTGATATPFWAGQSEVNLEGGFGTVRLGSFTSDAYFATADYISWHNHDTGTSADVLYADVRGFAQTDKVGYVSPSFSGLTFYGAVNAAQDTGESDRTYEVAAFYDGGALQMGFGYQQKDEIKQAAIRANYSFGAFGVGAYYQRDAGVYILGGNRNNFRVSAMYTAGASEFHVNVGMADDYSNVNESGATQFTLGYNYNLSKRTKLYGYYTDVSADSFAPYPDFSSFAVGIRHNF